ncbi:hypothetical protein HUG20_17305 [Salicibibacter cibi]|uniref:Uncharacterized protein n=1 Tax=Salicibibacter cibi TaxID=2743001 RepID=A0A7T7CGS8_9BACI|nr:hypothetical protein [Salicibibacter cibi]QQK81497.1 hypothetical protein HUG20_17305 [Salicibibacter cibi]
MVTPLASEGKTRRLLSESTGRRPRSAGFARGCLTVRPRKTKPWKRHPGFS